MRHRSLLPSLAAVLLAALSAPILGCSCGGQVGAAAGAVPAKEGGAVEGNVQLGFQGGGNVGPKARKCGPDGCPVEAK